MCRCSSLRIQKGTQAHRGAALIRYELIRQSKTSGMYSNVLEHWLSMDVKDRKVWVEFYKLFDHEYKHMLAEGSGTTKVHSDNSSLIKSVITYAKKATMAKSKVSTMKFGTAAFKIGYPPLYLMQKRPKQQQ